MSLSNMSSIDWNHEEVGVGLMSHNTLTPSAVRSWGDDERAALLGLLRLQPDGLGWHEIVDEVSECASARVVWERHIPAALFGNDDTDQVLDRAHADIERWRNAEYHFHTFMDDTYPERLRSVRQVPPFVFTWGERLDHDLGVSIVGSRKMSARGANFARTTARLLAERGTTIIAGLALGIDTVAHEQALRSGGRTVAVLGNGIEYSYPRQNTDLQRTIAERGMLLSQYMPDFRPTRWSFPERNVTMSAYGYATVIVEATEISGTRIQAREAVAHGRPVILSVDVATSTRWAHDLVHQPGVFVAGTPEEAVERIDTVLRHERLVMDLLSFGTTG
ncbi:DNA-processing protein DprA [Rhodococcus sp. WS4]|nr:DNA-processing protein DprA [Rhodococcus sp. WS4]